MNRMKNFSISHSTLVAAAALTALAACAGCSKQSNGAVAPERLIITGSSTIAPLIAEVAKRYEADHEGIRVDVQTGGSSRGLLDTRKGLAQIGMVSRALRTNEKDLHAYLLARDGVGMIVHADNPMTEISADQVVDIYTGKIADWQGVGTGSGPITVVHKAAGRSTHEVFIAHFGLQPSDVKASVIIGDNEQGIKSVSSNPGAIGYVSIGAAEISIDSGVPIKLLKLSGVEASTQTVADGSFPLNRQLNLITLVPLDQLDALTADFVRYALSSRVHDLISAQSFVAVE